jgi:hypothetical protein
MRSDIRLIRHLPRRGNRTQPRVLTLGVAFSGKCPEGAPDGVNAVRLTDLSQAERSLPSDATREALRSRPRIRPRGVMEYWSVGVLRQFGIEPRGRGVGSAFRAYPFETINPGLKPWAELFNRFAVETLRACTLSRH